MGGKECHTNTVSCKEGWILWSSTATMASPPLPGLLWAEEVKALSPGPPPTVLQLGFLLVVQPQVVVVLYRFCQQTTYLWGLHSVSKAPSEFCQKGDRAASLRGLHPKGIPTTSWIQKSALGLLCGLLGLFIS